MWSGIVNNSKLSLFLLGIFKFSWFSLFCCGILRISWFSWFSLGIIKFSIVLRDSGVEFYEFHDFRYSGMQYLFFLWFSIFWWNFKNFMIFVILACNILFVFYFRNSVVEFCEFHDIHDSKMESLNFNVFLSFWYGFF